MVGGQEGHFLPPWTLKKYGGPAPKDNLKREKRKKSEGPHIVSKETDLGGHIVSEETDMRGPIQ